MIDKATVFKISPLTNLGWSDRRIARHLRVDHTTVKKNVQNPDRRFKTPVRRGPKLDTFLYMFDQLLERDPKVKSTVVL